LEDDEMRKLAIAAMLSLAAWLVAPTATAATGDEGLRLDANKDGKIERNEFPGNQRAFDRLDRNHDGVLTADEIQDRGARANRPQGPAAAGAGGGAQRRREVNPMLAIFDANRDGKVTREEMTAAFTVMDANNDGSVDDAESGRYCRIRLLLAMQDRNGDGAISNDEVEDRTWERLAPLDRNGDGKVTLDELEAFRPGERGGPGPGAGGAARDPEQIIRRMDRDGNGKVSRDEWRGDEQMFDRIDSNADGYITAEELSEARAKAQEQKGGQAR